MLLTESIDHSTQRYYNTDPAVYLGDFSDISDAEDERVTSSTKWVARKDNVIHEKRQEEEEEGDILLIAAEDGKNIQARINIVKRGRNPEAPSEENHTLEKYSNLGRSDAWRGISTSPVRGKYYFGKYPNRGRSDVRRGISTSPVRGGRKYRIKSTSFGRVK